jgi:hypothetical protein
MPKDRNPAQLNNAVDEIDRAVRKIWESRNSTRGYRKLDERIAALEEQMDAICSLLNRL